jgi:hypothetical protein
MASSLREELRTDALAGRASCHSCADTKGIELRRVGGVLRMSDRTEGQTSETPSTPVKSRGALNRDSEFGLEATCQFHNECHEIVALGLCLKRQNASLPNAASNGRAKKRGLAETAGKSTGHLNARPHMGRISSSQ